MTGKVIPIMEFRDHPARAGEALVADAARAQGFGAAIKAVTDKLSEASDGITRREMKLLILSIQNPWSSEP